MQTLNITKNRYENYKVEVLIIHQPYSVQNISCNLYMKYQSHGCLNI